MDNGRTNLGSINKSSDIPPPPYRHTLWTFHIAAFVNTIAMVVNSDIVVYMCMEGIICQSYGSPERLIISQNPRIGRTSYPLRWEKECGGNSPSFRDEFCKTLPTQTRIFLTFQNCWILDLPHFCICQYDKYGSKKLYSTVHVCGSYDLSIYLKGRWDPWHRGKLKSAHVGEGMWRQLSHLLEWVLQNSSFSKQDMPNLPKLWHIGPSTFLYLSIW